MAAGELLPWIVRPDDRMAPRCACTKNLEVGEKVVVYSSDYKIGHMEIVSCMGCDPKEVEKAHGS